MVLKKKKKMKDGVDLGGRYLDEKQKRRKESELELFDTSCHV